MNQDDMITRIAQRTGCTREKALDALVDLLGGISTEIDEGGRVHLPGLGSLVAVTTAARTNVRNPATGEALPDIPAGRKVKFTVNKAMKARLASPRAAR